MRRLPAIVLALAVSAAAAQSKPPALEPLPEPPPPPPIPAGPGPDEPRVRIPVQEGDKIEPIREQGRVIAVKVTPPNGRPYYLIDSTGRGGWIRRESLDDAVAFPMFPIVEFD